MKKLLVFILLLIIVFLSGCTELRRAKVLLPHSWVGMQKVSSHLYVEKSMSDANQTKIKIAIPKAKAYVRDIYGEVTTQPIIYACQSKECAESLGLEGKVIAVRLLGHMILTNRALNKEVISHEWSHEELYERIGGFYHWYKEIPLWFDEGVASLTMHTYSRYDHIAWNKIIKEKLTYPKKEELVTLAQWNKANHIYLNNDEIVVPYATARQIITKWYANVGKDGLVNLLQGIKDGKHFDELYGEEQ
ncbi:MAG TPA: hypothetical protein ENK68_03145 [Epsilonproteobacteria bacterium]|nr:hypothetical protein [Campylobacterota bacterium]